MKTFNLSHSDFKANIGEGLDMILDFFANSIYLTRILKQISGKD